MLGYVQDAVATGTTRTAKGTVETVELGKAEQTSARRVAEAKATIPHIHLEAPVDAAGLIESPIGAELVAACATALRRTPRFNGAYRDGRLELYSRVNVAFALPAPAAQAPTIFDADLKSVEEIAAEIESLAARASTGSITAAELSGATFTIEDLSASPATVLHGVVTPGQAAMLTAGRPIDGALRLCLAVDNRIASGAEAAEFLGRVQSALEQRTLS